LLDAIGAPPDLRVRTDWRILAGAAVLAVGAALAFGLAPALQTVRGGPTATRARRVLVAIQVASSCVLLILSTFFSRGIERSFHADLRFDAGGIAIVDPTFYAHRYAPAQAIQAAREMVARVREMPGIDGASVVTEPPLWRRRIEHHSRLELYTNSVDAAYFSMMHLPLMAGRLFGDDDPDAMVVSESAASRLWPIESPLELSAAASSPRTICTPGPISRARTSRSRRFAISIRPRRKPRRKCTASPNITRTRKRCSPSRTSACSTS